MLKKSPKMTLVTRDAFNPINGHSDQNTNPTSAKTCFTFFVEVFFSIRLRRASKMRSKFKCWQSPSPGCNDVINSRSDTVELLLANYTFLLENLRLYICDFLMWQLAVNGIKVDGFCFCETLRSKC